MSPRRSLVRTVTTVGLLLILGLVAVAGYFTRDRWWSFAVRYVTRADAAAAGAEPDQPSADGPPRILELSPQARKNLGLTSRAAKKTTFWRTVSIPATIVDRPGLSDRGVTSPAVGVVTAVHAYPGDTVRAGGELFTVRLFSEYLQSTQTELFKATREVELLDEEIRRVTPAAEKGAVAGFRVIELNNQRQRELAIIRAARQDLLTRGLTPQDVDAVTQGTFVSEIVVTAPPVKTLDDVSTSPPSDPSMVTIQDGTPEPANDPGQGLYEVQALAAELGQQVQAGQLLATLSSHRHLYLAGHAFKREAPYLEAALAERRPIEVEFADDEAGVWSGVTETFTIHHLANAVDKSSRTFDFFLPLTNPARVYQTGDHTHLVWRFRPGQRARLDVPVEKYAGVFVLPAPAIVREGPEAYVFRQNGDLFDRRPVHVLYEDRNEVVIADDGSITPGMYLAQGSAASLNRVLKAQAASGEPVGVHTHPDGTTHAAH